MARFRGATFTLNNYEDADIERLSGLVPARLRYLVFQRERGANGTPHLQGFGYSDRLLSLEQWREVISVRAHIERTRGSPDSNRRYCTKEDTREGGTEPYEFGDIPRQGARSDLSAVFESIQNGSSEKGVLETYPAEYIKYSTGIKRACLLTQGRRNWQTEVFWFYGSTGTGKSRAAFELAPGAYWKPGSSKWWDGYDGEADVIIDDYRRDLCTFSELLRLFDRYPHVVECKGGSRQFVARRIFVTTPRCPRETWAGRTEEDLNQLMRRITEIRMFGEVPLYPLFVRPDHN